MTDTDRDEIIALTIRYCWILDLLRFDELDQVFARDAVADYGSEARYVGPEQLGAFFAAVVKAGRIDRSQHLVGNHEVVVDGDRATCRSAYQSHYALLPDGNGQPPRVLDTGGTYLDELRRTKDGWRITNRAAVRTWMLGEEAPGALTPSHDTAFVVAGWFEVDAANRKKLMAAAESVTSTTSQEDEGCLEYSLATDSRLGGRVRVLTRWRSEGDFRKHMDSAHVAAFRAALDAAGGVKDSALRRYVVSEETPVRPFAVPTRAPA